MLAVFRKAIVLCAFVGALTLSAAPATAATTGSFCGFNRHCTGAPTNVTSSVHAISTAYVKSFAQKHLSQKELAHVLPHMLHRVTQPMAHQPSSHQFDTVYSSNWSGYVSDTSTTGFAVSAVVGEFNNASESGPALLGTWVGIGGYNSASLIQTGVDQLNNAAWYELLPAYPVYVFGVNPNDEMFAYIEYDSSTGNWYLLIEDQNSGTYYANEFSYGVDTTTADWIEEQASPGNLPSVGPAVFNEAYWASFDNPTQGKYIFDSSAVEHEVILDNPDLNGTCGFLVPSAISGITFQIDPYNVC